MGGVVHTVGYGFNAAGQLATITYPSGAVIQYTYSNNRPVSVTLNPATTNTPILTNADYEPFGPVGEWTWGNSTAQSPNKHTKYFDLDGRIGKIEAGASVEVKQYVIDIANRITGIETLVSGSVDTTKSFTYGYDNLDRLTSQTPQAGNPTPSQGFTYDKIGNRLTQTKAGATTTYNYPSPVTSHRLMSLSGATAKTYTYDAVGNRTGDGTFAWSYGGNNRPVQVSGNGTTVQFKINALGQRVMKSSTGAIAGTTRFVYDEAGRLIGEYDVAGALVAEYVWLGDVPVAVVKPAQSGGIDHFYVHADQVGTPRAISRPSDNALVWRWDNTDPFGDDQPNVNPSGLGTFIFNLRFPGQYSDVETGTHQNYFRDYDPKSGRYVQSDPVGQGDGPSTYGYVHGNPLAAKDPMGLACVSSSGTTYCSLYPGPTVKFPTPPGFPTTFDGGSWAYHYYYVQRQIGCRTESDVLQELIRNPTPYAGNPRPATAMGTRNNAKVFGVDNYVTSYLTSDLVSGEQVVVNVTDSGSLFTPGYVVRRVRNGALENFGEGMARPQADILPWTRRVNDWVWGDESNQNINNCTCKR